MIADDPFYAVLVQAGPEEILQSPGAQALNLETLLNWPSIKDILVVLPDLEGSQEAQAKLRSWGLRSYVGDPYNVCFRISAAQTQFPKQKFFVRVLAIWKHIDLEYVDLLVRAMRREPCDFVTSPKDFEITMAADVASLEAIGSIGSLAGESQEIVRARFNPWAYMEMHPEKFRVRYLEPAPFYSEKQRRAILSQPRCHPENEFFGCDYGGSGYHFLLESIQPGLRILDIACGSGFGTELLSRKAEFVLGVDYLEEYIIKARERYPENNRLRFAVGDAQHFVYQGREGQFDLVTSFHTLEHVSDDRSMLVSLYRNLRPSGQLVLEVPLQTKRPLGVPINPYHLREYTQEQIVSLVESAGFTITNLLGVCRSLYGKPEQAREAFQVRALKP